MEFLRSRRFKLALCAGLFVVALACASALAASADSVPVFVPNDQGYQSNPVPWQNDQAPQAWAITRTSPVTIAILDSGVNSIPDLNLAPSFCVVSATTGCTTGNESGDLNGHGTVVASIAAAIANNVFGIPGLCPGCKVLPGRVTDNNVRWVATDLVTGINTAVARGAKIINLSLQSDPGSPHYQPLIDAIANAEANGVSVVIAAGNYGSNDPAVDVLASDNPEAIRVAGVNADGTLSPESDYGPLADIAAPITINADQLDGTIGQWTGTSMSAPQVAGALAEMLSCNPSLTPSELKADLLNSGTPKPGLDVLSGKALDSHAADLAAGCQPVMTTTTATTGTTTTTPTTTTIKTVGGGRVVLVPAQAGKGYPPGKAVKALAKAKRGWRFRSWGGACSAFKTAVCTVKMNHSRRVTAVFVRVSKK